MSKDLLAIFALGALAAIDGELKADAKKSQSSYACECCLRETQEWKVKEIFFKKVIICEFCDFKECTETIFNCAHKDGRSLR